MEIRQSVSGTNEIFILVSFPVAVMKCSNKRNLKGCSWLPHSIPFPWGCLGISVLKQVEPFQKPPSLGFYFVTISFIKSMGMWRGKNALHMFGGWVLREPTCWHWLCLLELLCASSQVGLTSSDLTVASPRIYLALSSHLCFFDPKLPFCPSVCFHCKIY